LTAGVLELKGNFTQKSTYQYVSGNFYTKTNHKVILSGSQLQTVSFEDPSSGNSEAAEKVYKVAD
jgi:hypothetical protein